MDILHNFDLDNLHIINELKKAAIIKNIDIYLVGGAVRDSLIKIPVKDLDFSLSRDPREILSILPFDKYSYNLEFNTAKVTFKDKTIDLILARKEFYKFDGALPKVMEGTLYDDLYRRDFTINSLAYDIKNNKIIDYFSGIDDIINRKIRKVHKNSYMEDGTRIYRAVKYKVRYDFSYEDEEEINQQISNNFNCLLSNDRVVKEIILLLKEDKWIDNVLELSKLKIIKIDENRFKEKLSFINLDNNEDRLIKFIISINDKKWIDIMADNSIINKNLRSAILNYSAEEILNNLIASDSNDQIYYILKKLTLYDLKFLMSENKALYKVINYNKNLSKVLPSFTGKDLLENGYKEGKQIGKIIENDLRIKLNTLV